MIIPDISLSDLKWAEDHLEAMRTLAISFHEGQLDLGGTPYYRHLQYVVNQQDDAVSKVLAWLHDSIEEKRTTPHALLQTGVPLSIVARLDILTKRETQSYEEYIREVAKDHYTRKVKIKDLEHNLQLGRLKRWSDRMIPRIKKYMLSLQYLTEVDRAAQESIP